MTKTELKKKWADASEAERQFMWENAKDIAVERSLKLSQMVEDGRLSATNAKKVWKEMRQSPPFIIYFELKVEG